MKYGDFIYSEGSDSSLWVNLFIPSQLNWTDRKMIVTQDTDIPSSDKTVLTVKTEKPQSVIFRLRYPEWAESMRIKVNGSSVSFEASNNSYVSIEREWKDNDKIEITFKIKFYTVSMPDNENGWVFSMDRFCWLVSWERRNLIWKRYSGVSNQ